jgi:hypothetical protein
MQLMGDVKHVVRLTSDEISVCPVCDKLPADMSKAFDIAESINHYLNHGYKVLHVGQETSREEHGLYHMTVAVLGKE